MTPELAAGIAVAALFIFIALEMPVALALISSGVVGLILMGASANIASVLASTPYTSTAKYALFVIPMYILLGCLIANAGIGRAIYRAVNRVIGRIPGGLAATAVGATTMFSGISGSSAADVAAFGRISVQEMGRYGYKREYAAAVVAAAGAFAALIPPSIAIVLYGITAEVSIAALIFAGIIPGVLSCLILMGFVIVRAMRGARTNDPRFGGAQAAPRAKARSLDEAWGSTAEMRAVMRTETIVAPRERRGLARFVHSDAMGIVYAIIIFAIVVGGMYGGYFTATEAGALGAVASLIIMVVEVKKKRASIFQVFAVSMRETVGVVGMIFLLIVGGAMFGYMLTLSGLPRALTTWAGDLDVPPALVIAMLLLILLPLGAVLDGLTAMLITVPLMSPIVLTLGFDPIWFGILVLKMIEIGLITPPIGINAFIISSATGIRAESVFRYLTPFVILDLALTAIYFVVPEIILWLPRVAGLL
ncbi:TRAP transporter large permease [Microbacterium sp. A94]|uniref:TRAP transporter large permease n=1 Tax=Microbacterium sp. A94 TaxID=3450717 RepID=UPI003F43E3AD